MNKVVKVGVGTMIFKDNKLLFGLRSNSHGKGSWCFPGGHLEFGETPEECAIRETREETGLIISKVKQGPWFNSFFSENDSQYITLFMIGQYEGGEPENKEENKFKSWNWFPYHEPPSPLFLPIQTLLMNGYQFTNFYNF